MSDWTEGYRAELDYTYGYYAEMNPMRVKLAFLNQGLAFPEMRNACELGFGQGVSINIHAAASPTKWFGNDFNPAQAGFARDLASSIENHVELTDESFLEFCRRDDLPEFDFIGVHGIWSWISDENRTIIVDFLRRKLAVGGVLYISYNTLPGWSNFAPMRHLLSQHSQTMGADGIGIKNRMESAFAFADQLLAVNPGILRALPAMAERLDKVKQQNRNYLAGEYFNHHWYPMYYSSMAEWLKPAKLNYACSAHYIDHIDGVNFSEPQQKLLSEIGDLTFRETVRDFIMNQQFRRDYWIKGARRLSPADQWARLRQQRVVLTVPRSDVLMKVNGALGSADMHADVYTPILDIMADYKPMLISQLEVALAGRGLEIRQIIQALMVLIGNGSAALAQDDATTARMKKSTARLNAHICRAAHGSTELAFLASPLTGGGIAVNRFQQLFLAAISQGRKQPTEWAQYVLDVLMPQGQRIIKEGKTLETIEENRAELEAQAEAASTKTIPLLKALQVI